MRNAGRCASGWRSIAIRARGAQKPGFYFFRIVWTGPSKVIDTLATLRRKHPDLDIEVVDPYTFFRLFKEHQSAVRR